MRIERRAIEIAHRGISVAVAASGLSAEQRVTASYYLLVTGCNVPGALAAQVLGCTKQNISKALRKVEDRRDDPAFDAALAKIEKAMFGEG